MMKRTLFSSILAVAFVLLGTANARADLITWGYNWSASPSFVTAGTGKVTLSDELSHTVVGDSNTVATALKVFSSADPRTPDTFGPLDGKYSLTIALTDVATAKTGSLTFAGQLQGNFSQFSSNITNTFALPTTKSIDIGGTHFSVTMAYYTPPGPPDQNNLGSIGAFVHVEPRIRVSELPEPSTTALAGIGIGVAGLAAWRRRRKLRIA